MQSSRPPDEFELALEDEGLVGLRLLGPSAQGWVCTTRNRDACYRLLPIRSGHSAVRECEDTPVERRESFRGWMNGAPSAPSWTANPQAHYLAPITHEGQAQLPGHDSQGWYYVRYDIRHTVSLSEILAGSDPHTRIDAVILVLYRIQGWWRDLRRGLIPFATDIVFDSTKRPFLLPTPAWKHPDIGSFLAEPTRALFLAPEYLRGITATESDESVDRFAVGAVCLQAFRKTRHVSDFETCLLHAATGSVWQDLASNLPFWLQRLQATSESEMLIRRLIAPLPADRATVDLPHLITSLESCRRQMEPVNAVREFLAKESANEAYSLLQDILLVDDSYDMLMLAAEVAWQSGRPLEAVDLLERAIDRGAGDIAAVRQQFQILMSKDCRERIESLLQNHPDLGPRIDDKVWRDFLVLDGEDPSAEWEDEFVDHMLWRGMEIHAIPFIYQRLFDAGKTFLWWKFPLRFDYVRCLFGAGSQLQAAGDIRGADYLRASRAELESIKAALYDAHGKGLLTANQRKYYFRQADALDQDLTSNSNGSRARKS